MKIDGKERNLQRRKYCFECSPFKTHNTKKLEIPHKELGCECDICGRQFTYKRRHGGTSKICNSCHTKRRRYALKAKCVSIKGGKCIKCGYNRCDKGMCFHHIDCETKMFEMTNIHYKKWSEIITELKKCILLCHTCHIELHENMWDINSIKSKVDVYTCRLIDKLNKRLRIS